MQCNLWPTVRPTCWPTVLANRAWGAGGQRKRSGKDAARDTLSPGGKKSGTWPPQSHALRHRVTFLLLAAMKALHIG